jgi:hypothetical protein
MNCKGCERKESWPFISCYICNDWGTPRKTSVTATRLRAEFRIRDLPNTKQECQLLHQDVHLCFPSPPPPPPNTFKHNILFVHLKFVFLLTWELQINYCSSFQPLQLILPSVQWAAMGIVEACEILSLLSNWNALVLMSSTHAFVSGKYNSERACYHSVQNILLSRLLRETVKLKGILRKERMTAWTEFVCHRPVAGSCEHDSKPSGSTKVGEFLDYLSDYYLLRKDYTPWSYS